MTRETWVYPSDGSMPYRKGDYAPSTTGRNFPTVMSDLPDFVSPIDHKRYSGRAGMREHNLRHDVTPHADLKGLPYQQAYNPAPQSRESRADRKERIIHLVNSTWNNHDRS